MKIQIDQFPSLVSKWLDAVVLPKSTTIQKVAITMLLLQRGNEIPELLKPFADKEGTIDTDNLKVALEKAGGKIEIPYLNWIFDQADLDKLVEIANVKNI